MITDITIDNDSVTEGTPNGAVIGTISVSDDNIAMTHSITLSDDANGAFQLNEFNLILRDTTLIDYDTVTSIDIVVVATDSNSDTYQKTITINIIDANVFSVIHSISPSTSKVGTYPEITISGQHFTEGGEPTVYINGNQVSINSYSDTEIKFVLTENLSAAVYTITVLNGFEGLNQ